METPRPILEVDDLAKYDWPKIVWEDLGSDKLYWTIDMYRQLQLRLLIRHGIQKSDDDYEDPDPYAKYYIFYCMT